MGGLLFLAFAYFAVGQAAANRNGAQTAADAAALAAAQDTRDQLAALWVEQVRDADRWQEIFDGDVAGLDPSCVRAERLASQNDAHVLSCGRDGLLGYTVEVQTSRPVGDSIVPGTADKKATASATAVIRPLCRFDPLDGGSQDEALPRLDCEDGDWDLDPEELSSLPQARELFDVHLTD